MDPTQILIIDDEKAIRDSFSAYLEDCGYETLTAENGRIGLSMFKAQSPDLVIVDLRMPEVDGIQVLEEIKTTSPLTPLIVASGTGIISDAIDALRCGAWDYLLKPVTNLSIMSHSVVAALEKGRLKKENETYRKHLEKLVDQRTAELANANTNLLQINTRLRHIVDTTRSLSFCSEVQEFGSQLLEEFGRHMMASGGSLYLKEKEGLRLVCALDAGHAPEFIPFPLPVNSLFQKAISSSNPILANQIDGKKGLQTSGWDGYKDGSALLFPLPDGQGEIAGIMTLHSKIPSPFVEQDLEIGTILASYSCEALRAVRATEELKESESRFRKILDTISTGILIVDVENFQIRYMNPTAGGLLGVDPQEMIGKVCHSVFCTRQAESCPMKTMKTIDQSEETMLTADGREVPVLKTVSRAVLEGRECFIESFIDLSKQIRAEKNQEKLRVQLRQAQKMEALGTLARGIAHDFNNIISAIMGYSELGLQDLTDTTHPLYPKIQAINNAGHRAKKLVEQILAFSRTQEQLQAPVFIAPIVKEVIKLLQSSLPATIQIQCDISGNKPVMGDPTQIHQIIMNLCTNAFHAMQPSGGILGVKLEPVSIDSPDDSVGIDLPLGNYLKLAISDTGSGINQAIIERIFDPYFTTKERGKGTGLGLAVVHGIVKQCGGKITVESQLDEGTTFKVFFPVSMENANEREMKPAILPRGNERILWVDDEANLVEIGCDMLQRLGYRVTAITGGLEALEVFKRDPSKFDVVVSDYNMSGLAGEQLANQILSVRRDMPIIICTGFSNTFDKQQALAMGVRKILMKPLTMKAVALGLREVLDA